MFEHRKKIASVLIVFTVTVLLVASIPPARAQFVLASWEYPDEYGQGIEGVNFFENSTGSWVAAPYYTHYYPDWHDELGEFYFLNYYQDHYFLNWSAGVAMKLRVYSFMNSTISRATDLADGQNYIQHNVTVTHVRDIVFSQQNFTYYDSDDLSAPMYYYEYEVVLNFLPAEGQVYMISLVYEIYGWL